MINFFDRPSFWRATPGKKRCLGGKRAKLGLDFHSHLLPAVDDGMKTLADAIAGTALLYELGYDGAVLTPHVYKGLYENTAENLQQAFACFEAAVEETGLAFGLSLAGEYFTDEFFLDLIEKDNLLWLPVGGERWVLIEFPYLQETPFASPCMAALTARGYRPVIAHVERYHFVFAAMDKWFEIFARFGAVIQGDIGSLAGQHGAKVTRFARRLAARGLVDVWGTDLHDASQIDRYIRPGLRHLAPGVGFNRIMRAQEVA